MIERTHAARRGRSRPLVVICKCKSHCMTFNPSTGVYEGEGHPQSRSTRDNHVRDDRAMMMANAAATTSATRLQAPQSSSNNWIQHSYDDIDSLMSLPLSHSQRPFKFINLPAGHGPFVWPNDSDHLHANRGLYALSSDRANRQFLFVANRLWEYFGLALHVQATSTDHDHDLQSGELLDFIRQKMNHLTRLKEVEWSRQRGDSGVDVPFVNTG